MKRGNRKILALVLAVILCVAVAGCTTTSKPSVSIPPNTKPIIPGFSGSQQAATDFTAVYVSVFEDLAILSSYPVLELEGEEPECTPREISKGGSILCGGEHEREEPIRKVLITADLVPQAMNGWFCNMVHLEQIQGLEKIRTHHVTDMSHLFAGCERLAEVNVDGWNVSKVEDMTGVFEGCAALRKYPVWYDAASNEELG